jgi:hypothetical protein
MARHETDPFTVQLAAFLVMDKEVTISKVGRSFVLQTKNNKATIPQDMAPHLLNSYRALKKK